MNKNDAAFSPLPPRKPGSTPAGFEALKARIVDLRKSGMPFTEISRTTGVSVYLVKRALMEMGVQESAPRSGSYKLNIPRERIEELVAQGKTRYQIETILGISGRSVLTLLSRYGLKTNPAQHINLQLAQQGLRRCCQCGQTKSLKTDFYRQANTAEGRGYRCKDCSRKWLQLAHQRSRERKAQAPLQKPPASSDNSSAT